jgi:hypothetical protein
MKPFLIAVKNVLLWSHERGSWQYDVLCLLIVATIFVVPSRYLGDRDRAPAMRANDGKQIASNAAWRKLEIKRSELHDFLKKENKITLMDSPQIALQLYLRDRFQRDVTEVRHATFTDSDGQLVYNVTFK